MLRGYGRTGNDTWIHTSTWLRMICKWECLPLHIHPYVCVHFTLERVASACCITWLALCLCFIPSRVPVAGCKVDLSDLHHVWEYNDMYTCQNIYLHAQHPYAFSYSRVCARVCYLVSYRWVHVHFQLPRLPPSQPMPTLILLDLAGLDQNLLTKGKKQAAWRLRRQSMSRLY